MIYHGDCLDVLKTIPDNSVDSCVTDPPYGLSKEPDIVEVLTKWMNGEDYEHRGGGFMGKTWDSFVPGPSVWREVYRVLKPGAHALVFAGTRTQDLMTISLRMAGFEVRDVVEWLYFQGFPKSLDVSKAFDKRAGAARETKRIPYTRDVLMRSGGQNTRPWMEKALERGYHELQGDEPVTELARKWDGWSSQLKPSHEPIILARKPLDGTICDNVERWGTGAINIDACRIGESGARNNGSKPREDGYAKNNIYGKYRPMERIDYGKGRFPANCITLESDAFYSKYFNITPPELSKKASKKDRNSDWKGEEIALEPKDSGVLVASTRGQLKDLRISNPEYKRKIPKNANTHPTVKPTDLMAWLVRLVTPPGGTVLDPFAGSGSTLVAAKREGFGFIGIELMEEYITIAEARTGVKANKGTRMEEYDQE